jgi:multidrug efflux pump subunit AcrB
MKFNLLEWALKHRSFVIFRMIAATIGGTVSYFRLSRAEDPSFIIKTMVCRLLGPAQA